MKLKYLLIVAFTLVASLPLMFTLQYLNSFTTEQYHSKIESRLSEVSLAHKNRLLGSVESLLESTALISSRTQMRVSLSNWNNRENQSEARTIKSIIEDAKAGRENIRSITVYDKSRHPVSSTASTMQPLRTPPSAHGNIFFSFNQEENVTQVSVIMRLIFNEALIGAIKVDYDLSSILHEQSKGLGDSEKWRFALRDNEKFLLVESIDHKQARVSYQVIPSGPKNTPIIEALQGNEVILRKATDLDGTSVIASTRYLPSLGWGLVSMLDESEAAAIVAEEKRRLFFIETMIVIFSIGLGAAVSLYVARPIEGLIKHVENAADGRPYEDTLPASLFEVKRLTGTFNSMSRSINELRNNIESQVFERTKELDKENLELREIAARDSLTGLYNRRFFQNRLNYEFNRAKRYGSGLTLVLLDIDHFKIINDTKGHPAGDEVLIRLSSFLSQSLRSSDLIARIGGEEFCIILPEHLDEGVKTFIDRLRIEISLLDFQHEGEAFQVTCSFGVAEYRNESSHPKDILKKADEALYQAKRTGRNRIVYESAVNVVVDLKSRKK
ncbi:Response regulator containing a CheY-like receiver domain and a GGDEF domain [Hahella chejuensis KCTC 2396]|uniref:diguanylate cyclase n=1 Tax=Hahella chejuensis (strain KCTC 2396) TaxID=349521 RepID=Q2SHG3_HAHCH|nr:sensor domain-containing diguanylate cyclase [Hahella chejuensis]ABC29911.1 Response regulator containing a CheY-like receiver domain and a GGDEF domain [Hahella chejuensis KCTC 2396]